MDPFAKKILRGSLAFAAVLAIMFAVLTVFYLHFQPRCADQVISQARSPDRRWIAAVLEARCGNSNDQPFLTHVNLRPASEPIRLGYFSGRADEGEIFLLEQDAQSANVTVEWMTANELAISCSHCQIAFLHKRLERWQDVTIRYNLDQSKP